MSENTPRSIDDSQFENEVIKGKGIIVVDFWAPWCGPCHTMAPALDAFAEANAGIAKVFKLDVDDNPKAAEKYNIRTIPTIIFFKDGVPLDVSSGSHSEAALQATLSRIMDD